MLSDAEQRRLAEIERELRAHDPSFARRIADAAPPSRSISWCGVGAAGWLVVAALAGCLSLLSKSGWMALMALSAVCLSMVLWAADDG